MEEKKYVLAVPNFSEGADKEIIEAVVAEVKKVAGVTLVSYEPEADFNRTVVTIIGEPQPIKETLIKMGSKTVELVDMRKQKGTHPRIGAQDSLPIFPLKNISVEECVALAEEIGKEYFEATKVPVFFAADNARTEQRRALAYIRKGQYEGLKELLLNIKDDPERSEEYNNRKPDLSVDGLLSEKSGATIVSAEAEGLTAYNVFLATEDLSIAKKIARGVREPSGGFSTTRAVGIKFPEHTGVVVSVNMFDCINTPIYRVFEFVKSEATRYGVAVTGSEIVGPVKLDYLVNSLEFYLGLEGFNDFQILETHLMK